MQRDGPSRTGVRALAVLLSVGIAGGGIPSASADVVRPRDPDWAWAFDDGTGTTASATFGDVAGTLDGGANTTWETNAVNLRFQYAGNGAIEFSGGIANDSQVLLDDGAGTDKINISGGNNNAFTVSLWACNKDSSGNANRASLFGNWFAGGTSQNVLLQTPDSAAHRLDANARQLGDDTLKISGTVASDVWQHYVFVYDGAATHAGTATLFTNGVRASSSTSADVLENWADEGEYRIGGDSRGNNASKNRDYMFRGLIDEVAVWKGALSSNEVSWLHQNSVTGNPDPLPTSPVFTFAHWSDVHVGDPKHSPIHTKLQAAVQLVNALQPAFVVDTGDITTHPVYGATPENLAEFDEYNSYVTNLQTALYVVPGNHDIGYFDPPQGGPYGHDYETLIQAWEDKIGPLNHATTFAGIRFLFVNNNTATTAEPGYLSEAQLDWIGTELHQADRAFIFAHVQIVDGEGAPWGTDSQSLVSLAEQHGGVALMAFGHGHASLWESRNGITYIEHPSLDDTESVYLYEVYENEVEVWSYNVFSMERVPIGSFALAPAPLEPTVLTVR